LDDELAELEQEQLDNKMLNTGSVPVADEIQRLPAVGNGESKLLEPLFLPMIVR
jgi:charged multivesicular body protein 4